MNIDLNELAQLAPIFRELLKGHHISRATPELYTPLSAQQDAYRALFRAQGFELVCDSRGFYYFVPEQMASQVNKTAQRLALFTFILVEHLADQGRDPLSVLDGGSLGRDELPPLLDKYQDLFLQAEVTSQDELEEKILRRLVQLGFIRDEHGICQFLAPMHRFLDVCLSVQQDRQLAAELHSERVAAHAPLTGPQTDARGGAGAEPAGEADASEDEEQALARALAEERAAQEDDA